MKKILTTGLLLTSFLSAIMAQNAAKKSPLSLLLGGAIEFGGDEIAKIYFINSDEQSIRAGQGGTVYAGAQWQMPSESRFLLRGSLGIKYVTTKADNAHIRLTRYPIQFTANWMATSKIRLGAGWVTHQGIKFKSDGIGQDFKIPGSHGAVFEVAYRGIGLSYTVMQYKDTANNDTFAANAIGFTLTGAISNFGKKKIPTPVTKKQ